MGVKDRDGLVRGAKNSLCLFPADAGAICWVSAFQSYPKCSGPCGLLGPLTVTTLIPRYSAAGLRVCSSQGLWDSRKLGCLTPSD